MDDVHIRGRRGSLHFIRFPTSEMTNFLSLAKSKGMAELVTTVCATGGGAFKFEQNFKEVSVRRKPECHSVWVPITNSCTYHKQEVNMNLAKFDELDVLIKGILFAETHSPTECYYFENASRIEWVYPGRLGVRPAAYWLWFCFVDQVRRNDTISRSPIHSYWWTLAAAYRCWPSTVQPTTNGYRAQGKSAATQNG